MGTGICGVGPTIGARKRSRIRRRAAMPHAIAERGTRGLSQIGTPCGGGERLQALIPPRTPADDLGMVRRLRNAGSVEEQSRHCDHMQIRNRCRQAMPEWYPHIAGPGHPAGEPGLPLRRPDLIPAYIAVSKAGGIEPSHLPYLEDSEHGHRRH